MFLRKKSCNNYESIKFEDIRIGDILSYLNYEYKIVSIHDKEFFVRDINSSINVCFGVSHYFLGMK